MFDLTSLKKEVITRTKSDIDWRKRQIAESKKNGEDMKNILNRLKFVIFGDAKVYLHSSHISVEAETTEEARKIVLRIIDTKLVPNFERAMEIYAETPKWYYQAKVPETNIWFYVRPAPQLPGCKPIQKIESRDPLKIWMCEKE